MKTSKRKAVGGHHSTPTAFRNTHLNIALGNQTRCTARARCATFRSTPELLGPVLKNIVIDSGAFTHALSWVFSRPNTLIYGRDGLVRKAGRMAESMFLTSRPPFARKNASGGFQSHSGAETMTHVVSQASPRAALSVPTPAQFSTLKPVASVHALALKAHTVERQQAIENALSMALYFIRLPSTESGLKAATGRAIRAASMLKQACAESTSGKV